jgi:hypothetical protein
MSSDIKELEKLPSEAAQRSCHFTWTGSTKDTLMPPR